MGICMSHNEGFSRREFVGLGAAALAAAGLGDLLSGCVHGGGPSGPSGGGGLLHFGRFGIDEKLTRAVLAEALGRGGDHADIFFQHRVSNAVSLEDGAVNRAYTGVELGVGVRVLKGDQTGYGYTEDFGKDALLACARTAAAIADGPSRPGPVELHIDTGLPQRYPLKVHWDAIPPAEKLPILSGLNRRALAADARVKKVTVSFRDEDSYIMLVDSDGRTVEDYQPMTILLLGCVANNGKRTEQNGYNVAARAGFEFYTQEVLDRVLKEAVERTTILFDAEQPPAGEMPVVLAAGSSGILLHEAIGHGMEADFNRKGVSIYADKMGKPIAQKFVNIVDDATPPGARGAINVDDEGSPAGRTVLVEDGVLASYMHDLISAAHYKVKPTGNGRRQSYQFAPIPRMRATYMLPGPHKKDEIISSVKKGIYCVAFRNGQVQIGAGDFTFFVANGFLIEDGKLTRPIKDVNIIGNGPKVLEKVDMVADDLVIDEGGWTCGKDGQGVPVSQGLPTVRVSSITVGGREG